MDDRINQGIRYLVEEFSATREEFRHALHPGGDMLLDGLLSHRYARQDKSSRYVATDAGRRRLVAEVPAEAEA